MCLTYELHFFFSEEHGVEVARKKKKKLMNPEAFKCY